MRISSICAGAALLIAATSDVAFAATPLPVMHLKVQYANNFAGISGLSAARVCAGSPQGLVIEETVRPTLGDVLVRLVGTDGKEISRHVGAKGICGFARYASDYVNIATPDVPGKP